MSALGNAAAAAAAVALPIVAIDDTIPRRLGRTAGWVSRATWGALDDPACSWFPVGALTTINVHLLLRARWPVALSWGAASGLLAFLGHRTVASITPRIP